jgi:hypothetical protein
VSALAVLALVQAVTLSGRLQGGVTVSPETVRIGDPFTVAVRVRAPLGATVVFPPAPDSNAIVEPLDPALIATAADSVAIDQTARYRLAAWRTGKFRIDFPDVLVRQDIGNRRVEISGVIVTVVSVLPADSSNLQPKPQRSVFDFGLPWWVWALLAALAIAIFSLVYWLWRRRRLTPKVLESPYEIAQREFDRIEALELLDAGERVRHVSLMVEVLRDYLAAVVKGASTSQTSSELTAAMRRAHVGASARTGALLTEVDLVKFARRSVTADRGDAFGKEARAIVEAIHQATTQTEKLAKAA